MRKVLPLLKARFGGRRRLLSVGFAIWFKYFIAVIAPSSPMLLFGRSGLVFIEVQFDSPPPLVVWLTMAWSSFPTWAEGIVPGMGLASPTPGMGIVIG